MNLRRNCFTALFCAALGVTTGACSDAATRSGSEVTELGTVQFPLETFGESGTRYRLQNATFEIRDKRTGRVRATLFSENEPFSSFMSAELDPGDYAVTLLPGWFIVRSNDGGPIPFPTSIPPTTAPTASVPTGVPQMPVGVAPTVSTSTAPVPTATATATAVATTPATPPIRRDVVPPVGTAIDAPGVKPVDTDAGVDMPPISITPPPPVSTTPPDIIIDPFPPSGDIVNAALESNAIQDFTIFPNGDSFVFYTFRVGDNVVSFEPGRVNIGFEVIEDGVSNNNNQCDNPNDARRASVIETSTAAMGLISLRQAFDQMAANEGFDTSGEQLYHQIIDSYASADQARMPDAIHCGDEMTNGQPTLNGFPIDCNRREAQQFDNLDAWVPTAFVNRMDLAPENGAHCGQQRMIFANNVQGRMFFILEAQIPNPSPELGIEGCAPLAKFWADQVRIEDAFQRGLNLRDAFFFGSPQLQDQGFGPFVAASHYTVGTGQIRTNNFDDAFWTLREFKLATDDSNLQAVPFPVAEAPNGQLWNDNLDQAQGAACRDAFLTSLEGVLTDDPAAMSFIIPQECKDAESRNDFSQDYGKQMSGGTGRFTDQINNLVQGTGLDAFNIADRAWFSGSCIGCHNEANGLFLGNNTFAPFSLDFVHVGEFTERCPDGNECFSVSSALRDSFLPHRINVLENFVGVPLPPSCEGATGGTGATGGSGGSGEPMPAADAGVAEGEGPIGSDDIAIPPPIALPAANTPTETLVESDVEIRETFGARTLGGQAAQITH